MTESIQSTLGNVGSRKMLIWAWTFAFAAGFTVVRMLLPLFSDMDAIDDIPPLVKELLVWVTGAVALSNAVSKFSPAVAKGVEKS